MVLPVPGLVRGEKLPEGLATFVAVGRGGTPVRGRQLGRARRPLRGWLDRQRGGRLLEETGNGPAGVVLLDSFAPGSNFSESAQFGMVGTMFDKAVELGTEIVYDIRLMAMGAYHRLFARRTVR
jgi:hypothetical protein